MRRHNLTVAFINALMTPEKVKFYFDEKVRGMFLAVYPTGAKTFFVKRMINSRIYRERLGRYPRVSPEEARNRAEDFLNSVRTGRWKRERLDNAEFGALFTKYIHTYAKLRKETWEHDIYIYNKYIKSEFHHKKNITNDEIITFHNNLKMNIGLHTANRSLSLMSSVFNRTRIHNPCAGVKIFLERPRDRFLREDEIPAFFSALEESDDDIRSSFIYLLILTGARRGNVAAMCWDDLFLSGDEPFWRIPKTKNGDSQIIPLLPAAVAILKKLKGARENNHHLVFPINEKYKSWPDAFWRDLIKRAGIKDLRMHDLRRTLASWQVRTGASSFVIGKTLGHKTQQATAIYAQVSKDVTRDSMGKAVDLMLSRRARG